MLNSSRSINYYLIDLNLENHFSITNQSLMSGIILPVSEEILTGYFVTEIKRIS